MGNELAPVQQQMTFDETMKLGDVLAKSRYFADAKDAAQAVVKVLAGRELGFSPMASMTGIHIIEGKPAIGAHLMAAAIKRSDKYDFEVIRRTRDVCELAFYERSLSTGGEVRKQKPGWVKKTGHIICELQFFIETGVAISSKQVSGGTPILKDNWRKSPDDMLFARAISKGYRTYCPDLTSGVVVYTDGEIENDNIPEEEKKQLRENLAEANRLYAEHRDVKAGEVIDASYTVNGVKVDQNAPIPPEPQLQSEPAQTSVPAINDQQAADLATLIRDTKTDVSAILNHFKIPVLAKLPAAEFERVRDRLKEKLPKQPAEETLKPEQILVLANLAQMQGLTAEGLASNLVVSSLTAVPANRYQWLRLMLLEKADLVHALQSLKLKSITEFTGENLKKATLEKLRLRLDSLKEQLGLSDENFTETVLKIYNTDPPSLSIDQLVELESRMADKVAKLQAQKQGTAA